MSNASRSLDIVEPSHELAWPDADRARPAPHRAELRVVSAGLDLRQVADVDRRALGHDRLRQTAALPDLAHPAAEPHLNSLVQLRLRHDRIVRTTTRHPLRRHRACAAPHSSTGGRNDTDDR